MLIIECFILCIVFTILVFIISRVPINTLYNYPPKIQERVKTLKEYKDKIPTEENKIIAKVAASIIFLVIICVILRYINGYKTFLESFGYGFVLWTIVNLWDVIVLDIIVENDHLIHIFIIQNQKITKFSHGKRHMKRQNII